MLTYFSVTTNATPVNNHSNGNRDSGLYVNNSVIKKNKNPKPQKKQQSQNQKRHRKRQKMLYTWKTIEPCYSGVFNQPSWSKKLFIIIFKMTRNDIIQWFYHNYVDYTGICPRSVTIS